MRRLLTIGYEGTVIDEFVETLKRAGVTVLADVRAVALSRKPGFSKTRLRERLESEGIRYVHYIDLGDPKPGREAAREGRMNAFRSIYGEHLSTDAAQNALDALVKIAHNDVVCLLCFERDPSTCHRSIVADALRERSGTRVEHLFGGGRTLGSGKHSGGSRRDPRESAAAA